MDLLKSILDKAKKCPKRVVFHELHDKRIRDAIKKIQKLGIAKPILLGKERPDLKGVYISTSDMRYRVKYAKKMYELRKDKGWTLDECKEKLNDPNYFGTMMVVCDDADAMVAGSMQPTASTLRPALQLLKRQHVSGGFLMINKKRTLYFADCSVTTDPTPEELADSARASAKTMRNLGFKPKVAMLSFSTKGSAQHTLVDKVAKATALLKDIDFIVDGELQVDAALVPEVAKLKCPKAKIKGDANILIFPDLNAGNIGYKLAQRLGNMRAIGPIIQGLEKPVNDLSRGCTAEDIVYVTAIAVLQSKK